MVIRLFWLPLRRLGVDVSIFFFLFLSTPSPPSRAFTDCSVLDCKSLAPTWEQVARDFDLETDIVIAKVDCEAPNSKATAQENGIAGFPTIKFFPKGSTEPESYQGARSQEAFVSFLNERAGTGRVVGGGLNEEAGTIPSFDDVIVKTGLSPALVSQLKEKAAGDSDKYANYYVKVAEKLNENGDYATKEQTRLQKILDKGGSAAQKVDDIVSRKNVLRRFVEGIESKKEEL